MKVKTLTNAPHVVAELDFDLWFACLNPSPVLRFNATGLIEMANPAAMAIFGLGSDYRRKKVTDFFTNLTDTEISRLLEKETCFNFDANLDGKYILFTVRTVPSIKAAYLYGTDVTSLKITEERLLSSQGFLRKVIDSNPNLIFVKDRAGRFMLANEAVAKVYGTTVEDLLGKTDADFNESSEEVEHFSNDDCFVIDSGSELTIPEEQVTTAAGEQIWLETLKKPINLYDGRRLVLGVATDITARKNLQKQLLHSQKLEAVGQLAGGIAHDFNNLLTGMLGYSNLLIQQPGLNEEARHAVSMIRNAAEQATELTTKLLGFARKGKNQNIAVNIHQVIDETLALLNRTLEKNILIQRSLMAENCFVCGDPVQMQQIILNLSINARDSLCRQKPDKTGGKLTISTRQVPYSEVEASCEISSSYKNYLKISVSDTGCGIHPDNLSKIFEPFFTTKGDKHGTGLGLSMVYGIVRNHSGSISVKSELGKGSCFDVYLPCYEPNPSHIEISDNNESSMVRGKGRILLVDDHQVIRAVTSDMLKSLGYHVTTAQNGFEAIDIFKNNINKLDLVILDMIMPGMGARECFDQLKLINPNVKVVLSTGYVANNQVQEIMELGMVGFMQKPYMLSQLSRIVSDALEGKLRKEIFIH